MADIVKGYTFTNGETVTPAKLHDLVDNATVADGSITTAKLANSLVTTAKIADANVTTAKIADSAITSAKIADGTIVNADINAGAAIADTKLATISTAEKVSNSATTASSANTANAIVARDASGNFSAGTIVAALSGNASTASKLANARTITLGGDLSGSVSFDGSANATLTAAVADDSHNHTIANIDNLQTALDGKQANLGFTPVQQGGGTDQGTNKVYIGWASPSLRVQVDSTNFGGNWPINISGTASAVADAAVTTAKIADSNVTTAKIADTNVTTAKIANGAVTAEKLAPGAIPSSIPAGAVMPFAMNSAPTGWLIANGNLVPNGTGTVQGVTANFAALFAAVGTAFGAAGTLPNLSGIFVRGSGSQTISGINYNKTFGNRETDSFQAHQHEHTDNHRTGDANSQTGGSGFTSTHVNRKLTTTSTVEDGVNGTPRTASETRPANIALLYCIKF